MNVLSSTQTGGGGEIPLIQWLSAFLLVMYVVMMNDCKTIKYLFDTQN